MLDLHVSSYLLFMLHLGVLHHLKYFEPFEQASIHPDVQNKQKSFAVHGLIAGDPTLFSGIK